MSCTARIRPFASDAEVLCAGEHAEGGKSHRGPLRDYAFPGSATEVAWLEDDRRTFHGEWPGRCSEVDGCTLPAGHPGRCAP